MRDLYTKRAAHHVPELPVLRELIEQLLNLRLDGGDNALQLDDDLDDVLVFAHQLVQRLDHGGRVDLHLVGVLSGCLLILLESTKFREKIHLD